MTDNDKIKAFLGSWLILCLVIIPFLIVGAHIEALRGLLITAWLFTFIYTLFLEKSSE